MTYDVFGGTLNRAQLNFHPAEVILPTLRGIHQYSFYRPAEGERLSRTRHRGKGAQPVPKAVYGSGCCDKHKAVVGSILGPKTSQSSVLPLDHCDLLEPVFQNTYFAFFFKLKIRLFTLFLK